jgi:hypothetical protein
LHIAILLKIFKKSHTGLVISHAEMPDLCKPIKENEDMKAITIDSGMNPKMSKP